MAHNCAAVNPDFRWIERPGAFPLLQDRMLRSQRNKMNRWLGVEQGSDFFVLLFESFCLTIMDYGNWYNMYRWRQCIPSGKLWKGHTRGKGRTLYYSIQKRNANELRSNIFYCSFKNVPLFREILRARKFTYLRKKVRVDLKELIEVSPVHTYLILSEKDRATLKNNAILF